jgi:hypothetical protein
MSSLLKMAYIYRHIRLDKNEPFYIGIGHDNNFLYKRAYTKNSRNKYWKNIAKLGYSVDILLDGITWEEACIKEIEFIELYGRKDLGLGSLINLTNGGEGSCGVDRKGQGLGIKKPMTSIKMKGNKNWIHRDNKKMGEKISKNQPKIKDHKKYINQLDLNNNLIKKWKGFAELDRNGYNVRGAINQNRPYKGFIWERDYIPRKNNKLI